MVLYTSNMVRVGNISTRKEIGSWWSKFQKIIGVWTIPWVWTMVTDAYENHYNEMLAD